MTLIVSLRIPDGVVIAGDSLSTLTYEGRFKATGNITCPNCNHEHEVEHDIPMPPAPATTFSYARKVFPFLDKFGIGTYGAGLIDNKSAYFALRLLEKELEPENIDSVTDVAHRIETKLAELFVNQLKSEGKMLEEFPDNWRHMGVQVSGYDGIAPKTIEINIGKTTSREVIENLGCTCSGVGDLVQSIWKLYETSPESQPPYPAFSLQDAINYSEFLIRTTSYHQHFSQKIPTVGGDIDVALITPFDGFEWIRQKSLDKNLEDLV